LKNIWTLIADNGITSNLEEAEKKRLNFLNRLTVFVLISSVVFFLIDYSKGIHAILYIDGLSFLTAVIILLLINKQFYLVAKFTTFFGLIVNIGANTMISGDHTDSILLLIPAILLPPILFRKKLLILGFCILTISMFFFLSWYINNFEGHINLNESESKFYRQIGRLVVLIFCFLIIWHFKKINKEFENIIISKNKLLTQSNNKINKQKANLKLKNEEITSSIKYAGNIQRAILPKKRKLDKHFKDHFILYLPKDIVAGDFYWTEKIGDYLLIAIADCTGHGVPGAMVSVVCHNALNRSTREFQLIEPDLILNKTRELVIEAFKQGDEPVSDGMDISLCCINCKQNILYFSGAYNPLIIIRNDQMIELKGDRKSIGEANADSPFNRQEIDILESDIFYLFTDGFQDQFGGPNKKKLKLKGLKEILLSNTNKSMRHQKNRIEDAFNLWKDDLEQIDDVCIMGFTI